MRSRVEILYFDDCPHYAGAARAVRTLLDREGVAAEVELRRVADETDAQATRFLGSPTIRVDGRDVEPGAEERDDYGMTCRLYRTTAGLLPIPDERWIVEALSSRG
jgi:hypothetical protein